MTTMPVSHVSKLVILELSSLPIPLQDFMRQRLSDLMSSNITRSVAEEWRQSTCSGISDDTGLVSLVEAWTRTSLSMDLNPTETEPGVLITTFVNTYYFLHFQQGGPAIKELYSLQKMLSSPTVQVLILKSGPTGCPDNTFLAVSCRGHTGLSV